MQGNSSEYYRKREQQCRALAATAQDAAIRRVHLDFAERYASAAEAGAGPPASPGLDFGAPLHGSALAN